MTCNQNLSKSSSSFWQNFAKFQPEKYDFDLYKGFHQIFIISSSR
jgi:hypothetical protein